MKDMAVVMIMINHAKIGNNKPNVCQLTKGHGCRSSFIPKPISSVFNATCRIKLMRKGSVCKMWKVRREPTCGSVSGPP